MTDRRSLVGAVVAVCLIAAAPVAAQDGPSLVEPTTYLAAFDDADLRGVVRPPDEVYDLLIDITGNAELDARIRAAAEDRGYSLRPVVSVDLATIDGRELQAPVAEAWAAMRQTAAADGISLVMTSAHRDLDAQQAVFLGRLGGGTSDAAIDRALRTSAPPGYSKHQGGYTVDIGQAGSTDGGFISTAAYAWLSAYDFARAKQFGFIPSYPIGGERMGPDPEAWEFVWIGVGRIACMGATTSGDGFCDVVDDPRRADTRTDDIAWMVELGLTVGCAPGRFCPDDPITRGEAASLLWRLHGAPASEARSPFIDIYEGDHFRPAVDWMWENGVVAGTSAETFSPSSFLLPSDALALLLGLSEVHDLPEPEGLSGPLPSLVVEPVSIGALGDHISRAEFATVLRAAAAT